MNKGVGVLIRKLVITGGLLIVSYYLWSSCPMVPFVPVVSKSTGESLYDFSKLSSEQVDRIEDTLQQYGVPYFRIKTTILIPQKLLVDVDTLQNYTWKSEFIGR